MFSFNMQKKETTIEREKKDSSHRNAYIVCKLKLRVNTALSSVIMMNLSPFYPYEVFKL